jgi:hypothetical protein
VYAARNIAAGHEEYDIWGVNVEEEYHEEVHEGESKAASGDRMVPQPPAEPTVDDLVSQAFARFDAVALGGAVGVAAVLGLFLATAVLLVRGGENVGANLSLLGSYFLGFDARWGGAFLGMFEAGIGGFAFGWLLAKLINLLIAAEELRIVRRIEEQAVDLFEGND